MKNVSFENLSFYKLKSFGLLQYRTTDADSFEYISSGTAIKNDFISVQEISEQGSVNNINVINKSPHYIFFMDGDVLVGAKQNRVLNTSVLLEPDKNADITVSCIEQGRWRHKSEKFSKPDYIAPAMLRKQKNINVNRNLNSGRSYYSDQGEVWANVGDYEARYSRKSDTSDLSEIIESVQEEYDTFIKHFHCYENANGLAMFTEDKIISIEIFNRTDIYSEYFPKLLKSAAIEIHHRNKNESSLQMDDASGLLKSELEKLGKAKHKEFKGLAAGVEKRYDSEEFSCHSLLYNDNRIHFSFLNV